jgi:hypothetical protein
MSRKTGTILTSFDRSINHDKNRREPKIYTIIIIFTIKIIIIVVELTTNSS